MADAKFPDRGCCGRRHGSSQFGGIVIIVGGENKRKDVVRVSDELVIGYHPVGLGSLDPLFGSFDPPL